MAKKAHGGGGGGHGGGGLRWLITYADMITLLLALFIMLYAISTLDLARFQALSTQLQKVFSAQPGTFDGGEGMLEQGAPDSRLPLAMPLLPGKRPEMHDEEEELERYVEGTGLEGKLLVHREQRGLVVSMLTDGVFFTSGSAALSERARQVLRDLVPLLVKSEKYIRVEGHTCDLPIHTSQFPSNWELSAARASRVVRFLSGCGLSPKRLAAIGFGEHRPTAPNDTEEQRRLNRRVDLVLLTESASQGEPVARNPKPIAMVMP